MKLYLQIERCVGSTGSIRLAVLSGGVFTDSFAFGRVVQLGSGKLGVRNVEVFKTGV